MATQQRSQRHSRRVGRPRKKRQGFFRTFPREALIALALAYCFGFMPVLWNEAPQVDPIVFTAAGAISLLLVTLVGRGYARTDRWITGAILVYLVTYIAGTYVSYWLTGEATSERAALLTVNAEVLAWGALYYFAGGVAAADRRWGAKAGLLIGYATIAIYALTHIDVFTSTDLQWRLRAEGAVIAYQQLDDAFVIASLALLAGFRGRRLRARSLLWLVPFFCLSVFVMFVIPSRSAAAIGATALALAVVVTVQGRWRWALAAVFIATAASLPYLPLTDWAEGTRFESVVNDPSQDGSVQGREEIFDEGLQTIAEHPFTGEWAFQMRKLGRAGLYIHNALDVWAQAGVLAFLTFVAVWPVMAWRLWRKRSARRRRTWLPGLPLTIFALGCWVLSREAAYVMPFFGVGYLSGRLALGRAAQRARSTSRSRLKVRRRLRTVRTSRARPVVAREEAPDTVG